MKIYMKTTFINIICLVAVVLGLQSCYTDFDPKLQTDPVLCMNSVLESECPIKVSLSHSYAWIGRDSFQDYLNLPSYDDIMVKDAEVSLYINGNLKDVMTFSTIKIDSTSEITESGYFSDYCPAEGDEVKLVAVSKEYGVAEATVKMPEKVDIEDVDVETISSKKFTSTYATDFQLNQNFSVWFTDPADQVNFYRILVEPINPEAIPTGVWHESWNGEMFETKYTSSLSYWSVNNGSEPLFSEHTDVLDIIFGSSSTYFTLFSDRSIQGKRYPLSLGLNNASLVTYNPTEIESLYDVKLRFKFYNVSESYYNWFIYSWYNSESIQGSLTAIGFAEAINPPSNVSTNAGIVAACTKSTFDISYRDFLKTNYDPKENKLP